MGRVVTFDPNDLPKLAEDLKTLEMSFNVSGAGSRVMAARWLIEKGYQFGAIDYIAKKLAHILKGYVRGLREPFAGNGGIWSADEASRLVVYLNEYLDEHTTNVVVFYNKIGQEMKIRMVAQPPKAAKPAIPTAVPYNIVWETKPMESKPVDAPKPESPIDTKRISN